MKYEDYEYPRWAEALGWLIVAAIIQCLPLYMIIKVANCIGSFKVSFIIKKNIYYKDFR